MTEKLKCPLCGDTGLILVECGCCATLRYPFYHLPPCAKLCYPSGFRPCEGSAHATEAAP